MPGDPARNMAGDEADAEAIQQTRKQLGLDKPLHIQFYVFIKNMIKGDMGISIRTRMPIAEEIRNRYPHTAILAFGAVIWATLVGTVAGITAAVHQNKLADDVIMVLSLTAVSTPSFWLALMLMLIFSLHLHWLPTIGVYTPWHYLLPIMTLGTESTGLIARMTRSAMLDVLREDYIRTARSKGLAERIVIYQHALKNAILPVITIIGLRFGQLLAGTVIVETIFAVPGIGRFMIEAVLFRDYPVVQATVLLIAATFVIINMIVDLLYKVFDPRIRYT